MSNNPISKNSTSKNSTSDSPTLQNSQGENTSRRQALKQIMGLPVLGGLGAGFGAGFACGIPHEERHLLAEEKKGNEEGGSAAAVDGQSGATRTTWELPKIAELKEKVPHARLGDLEVSRMIMGGNLIGGWAHSRDLIYVSELVKNYHTKEKVFQTFKLAEECGINTFNGNPILNQMLEEYWTYCDGKMQFISDCGYGESAMADNVRAAIDFGCDACYIHGGCADWLVETGQFKVIEECFQIMRDAGFPTGLGAHYQSTIDKVIEAGLEPEFFMKTYHHSDYWSAQTATEHDNIFCREPEETKAFMAGTNAPWIAFKVLAAGAIQPEVGFRLALEAGADFICVGMYDFQMVSDVNLFCDIFKDIPARTRRMLPGVEPTAAEDAEMKA